MSTSTSSCYSSLSLHFCDLILPHSVVCLPERVQMYAFVVVALCLFSSPLHMHTRVCVCVCRYKFRAYLWFKFVLLYWFPRLAVVTAAVVLRLCGSAELNADSGWSNPASRSISQIAPIGSAKTKHLYCSDWVMKRMTGRGKRNRYNLPKLEQWVGRRRRLGLDGTFTTEVFFYCFASLCAGFFFVLCWPGSIIAAQHWFGCFCASTTRNLFSTAMRCVALHVGTFDSLWSDVFRLFLQRFEQNMPPVSGQGGEADTAV